MILQVRVIWPGELKAQVGRLADPVEEDHLIGFQRQGVAAFALVGGDLVRDRLEQAATFRRGQRHILSGGLSGGGRGRD